MLDVIKNHPNAVCIVCDGTPYDLGALVSDAQERPRERVKSPTQPVIELGP
jgi:hypothetical protein